MEIRQLEYFIAAAELNSFSKAAIKCNVVQPTISHQISNLEDELGVSLFERNYHNLQLTDAGALILADAKELVSKARAIVDKINTLKTKQQRRLMIGYYSTCIDPVFGSVVYRFAREHHVEVKLNHMDYYEGLFTEKLDDCEYDCVITLESVFRAMPQSRNSCYIPLYTAQVMLVLPNDHPLVTRGISAVDSALLRQLDEKFLLYAPSFDENIRNTGIRWHSETLGIPEDKIDVSKSMLELQLEIEAGNALGLMVETEVRSINAEGRLTSLPIIGSREVEIGVVYDVNRKSDLLDDLIQDIKVI